MQVWISSYLKKNKKHPTISYYSCLLFREQFCWDSLPHICKNYYSLRIVYFTCWRLIANFRWISEKMQETLSYKHILPVVYPFHSSSWNLAHLWWSSSAMIGFRKRVQLPSGKCLLPILTSQLCSAILMVFLSVCLMVWLFIDMSDVLYLVLSTMKRSGNIFLSCILPRKGFNRGQ